MTGTVPAKSPFLDTFNRIIPLNMMIQRFLYMQKMQIMKRKKQPWGEEGSLIEFNDSIYKAVSPRRSNPKYGSGCYSMDVVYLREYDDLPRRDRKTLLDGFELSWHEDWDTKPSDADLLNRAKRVSEQFNRRGTRLNDASLK